MESLGELYELCDNSSYAEFTVRTKNLFLYSNNRPVYLNIPVILANAIFD